MSLSSLASFVSALPVVGAVSPAVRGSSVAGARLVRAAVGLARARLAGAAVGLPVLPAHLAAARSAFSLARSAGCSSARLAVLARVGRLLAAAVCPLASGAGVPAVCLGVPSSGFLPAASGVVVRDWLVSGGVLSVDVAGFALPFLCLASGLSPAAFSSLVEAVGVAADSGVSVDLWAAPGRSGFVCRARAGSSGYFCAVSAR